MRIETVKVDRRDARLTMTFIYVAISTLAIGGFMGLFQVLVRSGRFQLPNGVGYYAVLTAHGVIRGEEQHKHIQHMVMLLKHYIGFPNR